MLGVSLTSITATTLIVGTASVYSENFEGKKTANGETFLHQNLTAAHRTLPFGTYVRLTRSDIGKSVIVKINDRGPYVNNCIVDISSAAAKQLGFKHYDSEYEVQLEVVNPDDLSSTIVENVPKIFSDSQNQKRNNTYTSELALRKIEKIPAEYAFKSVHSPKIIVTPKAIRTDSKSNNVRTVSKPESITKAHFKLVNYDISVHRFGVQVASLKLKSNAIGTISELKNQGINDVFLNIKTTFTNDTLFIVIVGEYASFKMAEPRLKMLKDKKIGGFIVKL